MRTTALCARQDGLFVMQDHEGSLLENLGIHRALGESIYKLCDDEISWERLNWVGGYNIKNNDLVILKRGGIQVSGFSF